MNLEDTISRYYLVQNSNKILKNCNIFEIVSLIEACELEGQSYIFDLRIREWCLVKDIQVLKDTGFEFRESAPKDCPSFIPPHKLPVGEFQPEIDCDYIYLRNHFQKIKNIKETSRVNQKNQDSQLEFLETKVEKLECDLEEKRRELKGSRDLSKDFEEIIFKAKLEAKELEKNISLAEQEKISIIEKSEKEKSSLENKVRLVEVELENLKREKDNVLQLNYKVSERNKALAYGLKLEKEHSLSLKELLARADEKNNKTSYSEELLNKAMEYFLNGPQGGEKEILTKKVELLTKELKEQESFYNLKIQKLKRESEAVSHESGLKKSTNDHLLNTITQQRDEFEYKYKNVLDLNKVLEEKIKSLEEVQKINNEGLNKLDKEDFKESYIQLASKYKRLEKDFNNLKTSQTHKESAPKDDSSTKFLKEELVIARNEAKELRRKLSEITSLNESLKDTNSVNNESEANYKKLISSLRADNTQLIEKFNSLKEKTSKYKVAYNDLSEKYKKIKNDYKESNIKFNSMRKKTDEIIESLKKKVDGAKNNYSNKIKELEEVKDREQTLMIKIEEFKKVEQENEELQLNAPKEDEEAELNRLIGDSFEVLNDAIWMIQRDNEEPQGPYKFSDVYHMKINGELDVGVKVKKGKDLYKVKSDIFELSVPVSTFGSGDDIRYFIKRTSMRVPFYEMITLEINGEEFKGYCTSLSLGGIFLELNKLSDELSVDKKGRVFFSVGALDNPFQCVAQIKNISESRPKGVGLMFVDLPDQAKEDISFYINNYLNKTKKSA